MTTSNNKLPAQLSDMSHALLIAIKDNSGKVDLQFLKNHKPLQKWDYKKIYTQARTFLVGNYITLNKKGFYSIATRGRYTLQHIDSVVIVPDGQLPAQKRQANAMAKKAAIEAPEPPQTIQANLSITAERLTDHMTAVLSENAQYRNLLEKLRATIDEALGTPEQESEQ